MSPCSPGSLSTVPQPCWCLKVADRRGWAKIRYVLWVFHGFSLLRSPSVDPKSPMGCPGLGSLLQTPSPKHFVPGMKGLPLSIPYGDHFCPKPPLPSR